LLNNFIGSIDKANSTGGKYFSKEIVYFRSFCVNRKWKHADTPDFWAQKGMDAI
jgi:hypothetical protein